MKHFAKIGDEVWFEQTKHVGGYPSTREEVVRASVVSCDDETICVSSYGMDGGDYPRLFWLQVADVFWNRKKTRPVTMPEYDE